MTKTLLIATSILFTFFCSKSMAQPDLAVIVIESFPAGLTATAGQPMLIKRQISDIGSVPAGPFTFSIRLSTNNIISTGDRLLASYSSPPQSLNTAFHTVTIPSDVIAGTYYLGVIVNPVPGEVNTANNYRASQFTVTILDEPDLDAVSISGPASVSVTSPLFFNRNIVNVGGPLLSSSFQYEIRLSTNNYITTSDILVGTKTSTTLGAGFSSVIVPTSVPGGTYYLGLLIPQATGETNMSNNWVSSTTTINIVVPTPTVTSISTASGPFQGGNTVHLYGSNFYTPMSVSVGGVTATNVFLHTSGFLHFTMPPAPNNVSKTYDVTVMNASASATLSNAYTYDPLYAGSDEDLRLRGSAVLFPTSGSSADVFSANGGDFLTVIIDSPGGTQNYNLLYFFGNAFVTGNPPASPVGYPQIHFNFNDPGFFTILDAGSPNPFFGPPVVLPAGNLLQMIVPTGAAGFSAIFQAVTLDSNSSNGWFVASDAFEMKIIL